MKPRLRADVSGVKCGVVCLVKLGVVSIKVMVKGKGGDESAEGVVYMRKSKGPRTEPWGTPQEEM